MASISSSSDLTFRGKTHELRHTLYHAKPDDSTDKIQQLLDDGADMHDTSEDKNGSTALFLSTQPHLTDFLISRGALVDKQDNLGLTPLFHNCLWGRTDNVQALLKNGADINKTDYKGGTALFHSTLFKLAEVVAFLLEKGANPNILTSDGGSPLMVASGYDSSRGYAMVDALLNHGAFINLQESKYQYTALHFAIERRCNDVFMRLLANKPNLELRSHKGETPLLQAVRKRRVEEVKLLLNAGASIHTINYKGQDILTVANKKPNSKILALVKEAVKQSHR